MITIPPTLWHSEPAHFIARSLSCLESLNEIPIGTPATRTVPLLRDLSKGCTWRRPLHTLWRLRGEFQFPERMAIEDYFHGLATLVALGIPLLDRKPPGMPWWRVAHILYEDRLGQWFERFLAITDDLDAAGFLKEGSVRRLETAEEGIAFVDRIAAILPSEFDFMDVFELLNFGSKGETKDINGALHRLGRYRRTWRGNKAGALLDFTCNEAQILVGVTATLKRKPISRREIETIHPPRLLHRLQVLARVLRHYVSQDVWVERLNMAARGHSMPKTFYELASRRVDEAISEFMDLLARAP